MRFPPVTKKIAGVVAPVSALRTASSEGVGDFSDLPELGAFCAAAGLRVIQILPVNDSGFQSSPYSALSAFALHPLYLRLGELEEAEPFAADIEALRRRFEPAARFPFDAVLRAKLDLLGRIYDANAEGILASASPGGALAAWIADNDWAVEYAVYRRLKEAHGGAHWKEWGESSNIDAESIRALWNDPRLKKEHLFWAWMQRNLDGQLSRAAAALAENGIALKGDLPILMNEDSCDVWAHPEYFRRDLSAGAPPDMYSPLGQNWGFPIYDWTSLEKDDYAWWRKRLLVADRYYSAYRIDHVLGFFRIWATSRKDNSAILGRFIPSVPIERRELEELGFDAGRIRWLSRPHVPGDRVRAAAAGGGDPENDARAAFERILEKIGNEDLWLFKSSIQGEADMERLGLQPGVVSYLQSAWRDRVLMEYEDGRFQAQWSYWDTRAFPTLSEDERRRLEELIRRKRSESELIWEDQGRRLLKTLSETVPMLPCAEDLGAVPDCVPRTLADLGILGLRVLRWTRAVLGATAGAGSMICVFQLQDLLHLSLRHYADDPSSERINVPGTTNNFNWTYRLPVRISEFASDAGLVEDILSVLGPRADRPAKKQGR
jgi:4-alpha-glucanotransferase